MKLPPGAGHERVVRLIERLGYRLVRQTGSHMQFVHSGPPEHHLSVPRHRVVRIGTLHSILSDVADHLKMDMDDLIRQL